jgi:hypothetical protein
MIVIGDLWKIGKDPGLWEKVRFDRVGGYGTDRPISAFHLP